VIVTFALAVAVAAAPPDTSWCAAATRFLRTSLAMQAIVERDTIDDWRTRQRTVGCRVTAAGATRESVQRAAVVLYERLRAEGFVRTPDPFDSPNEASLRFRRDGADCLYNVNAEALLFTDAEATVNEQLRVPDGARRYQVFVMCVPARAAAAR
jgi:hypothetical protein